MDAGLGFQAPGLRAALGYSACVLSAYAVDFLHRNVSYFGESTDGFSRVGPASAGSASGVTLQN
jgi:hypothetical protein